MAAFKVHNTLLHPPLVPANATLDALLQQCPVTPLQLVIEFSCRKWACTGSNIEPSHHGRTLCLEPVMAFFFIFFYFFFGSQ
jgi:hypothetical protein